MFFKRRPVPPPVRVCAPPARLAASGPPLPAARSQRGRSATLRPEVVWPGVGRRIWFTFRRVIRQRFATSSQVRSTLWIDARSACSASAAVASIIFDSFPLATRATLCMNEGSAAFSGSAIAALIIFLLPWVTNATSGSRAVKNTQRGQEIGVRCSFSQPGRSSQTVRPLC
jgi:hypothetical protein